MRPRLAVSALLLAGCSLFKFNVSTPETRRQEAEAAARAAEKARADDEARQKKALAERARDDKARDEARVQAIEAARVEVDAGVTADRAIAFAGKVRMADGTAPTRDGRLDMPKLWLEAAGYLERAAADGPSYPAFVELATVPRAPDVDAAVLRACPRVRPAVVPEAVPEFVTACLDAAGGDSKQLKWASAKADLTAYRKAEDARVKAEAEAAETARAQARTLAGAIALMFAAGRCEFSDCAKNGWTASADGGSVQARCSFQKCLTDGWSTGMPDGTEVRTRCSFGDCMKNGWETDLPGGSARTSCSFGDCAKNGWETALPGGGTARTTCNFSDCFGQGWDTSFPDGRTVRCRCEFGKCLENGATCS
ncbi:MAG: hypothetical protein JNL82_17300 [Myxococcales bacterium]|nr:hypothetical protein [Myxococcales bacterium]